jgi:hypothetical protein
MQEDMQEEVLQEDARSWCKVGVHERGIRLGAREGCEMCEMEECKGSVQYWCATRGVRGVQKRVWKSGLQERVAREGCKRRGAIEGYMREALGGRYNRG